MPLIIKYIYYIDYMPAGHCCFCLLCLLPYRGEAGAVALSEGEVPGLYGAQHKPHSHLGNPNRSIMSDVIFHLSQKVISEVIHK